MRQDAERGTKLRELRENFSKLKKQFTKLVVNVQDALKQIDGVVEKLRTFLSLESASFGSTLFTVDSKSMQNMATVGEIFTHQNEAREWDFLNFQLLANVLDFFELNGLISRLKVHEEEVKQFKQNTLMVDFLDIWSEHLKQPVNVLKDDLYAFLRVKFDIDDSKLKSITLAEFADQQGFITSQFLLQEYVLRFVYAGTGCISAVWYVAKPVEEYMIRVYKERKPDLAQGGVLELSIGNTMIFKVCIIYVILIISLCVCVRVWCYKRSLEYEFCCKSGY